MPKDFSADTDTDDGAMPTVNVSTPPAWMQSLPVAPGASLQKLSHDGQDVQVITLFQVSEKRAVGNAFYIAGKGYAEINGGGQNFAGMNRGLDPYIELTIMSGQGRAFEQCKTLLDPKNFATYAVAVRGIGYFAPRPGLGPRQLGVFRLDTLSNCKLVPRY